VILLGDLLVPVAQEVIGKQSFFAKRKIVQLGCVMITYPVTLFKNISSLRYTSFVSVMSIVFLAGVIVSRSIKSNFGTECVEGEQECNASVGIRGDPVFFKVDGSILNAFSIMCCAFLCHFNVVPTQNDLNDPNRTRLNRVIYATMSIADLIYTVVACFGYMQFRDNSCDNVLKNYDNKSTLITCGRAALALTLLLSFPLLTHPCRNELNKLINLDKLKVGETQLKESTFFYVLETTLLVSMFYVVGVSINSIVTVWSFLGSTVCIIIGYILPAIMYLKIRPATSTTATFYAQNRPRLAHSASGNAMPDLDHHEDIPMFENVGHIRRAPAVALLVFGVIVMVACTTQAVLDAVKQSAEPEWCKG